MFWKVIDHENSKLSLVGLCFSQSAASVIEILKVWEEINGDAGRC